VEVDPKEVETYFVTIERNPKTKKPIGIFKVSSGARKVNNALKWVNNALDNINKERFIKNKSACNKYSVEPGGKNTCVFYKTKFCP
jgi:hypothetical protein